MVVADRVDRGAVAVVVVVAVVAVVALDVGIHRKHFQTSKKLRKKSFIFVLLLRETFLEVEKSPKLCFGVSERFEWFEMSTDRSSC